MHKSIADLRREYAHRSLNESEAANDPFILFGRWWEDAIESQIDEVNAITLATSSLDGLPSARIVLLKGYGPDGFIFYTNYESYKAKQLEENPRACLVFFWKELERQIRITGLVSRISEKQSDEYFHSRPQNSQLGAIASPQSRVIESREWLERNFNESVSKYADAEIPRPKHWGGYIVRPIVFEFWQGRPSRLHDRLQYSLGDDGDWVRERLAP